jgi:hypothetical protein
MSFNQIIERIYEGYLPNENYENNKHQKTNLKQIPMTQIQNSKHGTPALVSDDVFISRQNLPQRYAATVVNVLVIGN